MTRSTALVLAAPTLGLLLAACGGSQFGGNTGTTRQGEAIRSQTPSAPGAVQPASGAAQTAGDATLHHASTPGLATGGALIANWQPTEEHQQKVKSCLMNLGIQALPQDALDGVRVLASSSFSPFANDVITDDQVTSGPAVVFVDVSGFGPVVNFDLNLLNPNGIYCVDSSSFAVFTNRKITICKTAKIGSDQQSNMDAFSSGGTLKVGCN